MIPALFLGACAAVGLVVCGVAGGSAALRVGYYLLQRKARHAST